MAQPGCDRSGSDVRAQVIRLAQETQGISKTELCDRLGLAWGTVSYHVDRLERSEEVSVLRDGRNTLVFPAAFREHRMRWLAALRRPEVLEILDLLKTRRELTIPCVMDGVGVSRRVARSRLLELEAAGVLERRGTGRPRFGVVAGVPAPRPCPA